jgi:hypothetical protein
MEVMGPFDQALGPESHLGGGGNLCVGYLVTCPLFDLTVILFHRYSFRGSIRISNNNDIKIEEEARQYWFGH